MPVRSKAAELCNESAKPKGPPRHRQKVSLIFEHPLTEDSGNPGAEEEVFKAFSSAFSFRAGQRSCRSSGRLQLA